MKIKIWIGVAIGCLTLVSARADIAEEHTLELTSQSAIGLRVYQANQKTFLWSVKINNVAQSIQGYAPFMYWTNSNRAGSIRQTFAAFDETRVRARIPAREVEILKRVADEYRLPADQRALLFGIRVLENGRLGSGIEMGVGQEQPDHRARRYAGNWRKSLRLQAKWAAGTIQKNFTGDLASFAKRWCPVNAEAWAVTMLQILGEK